MPSHRMQHIFETIKRELPSVIRELNDPRVKNKFIDIVKTDISKDMSLCRVYISSIGGFSKTKTAENGLNSAVPYIKKELGKRLELRRIPDIKFIATDSIEYSVNMIRKINDLNIKNDLNITEGDV